MSPPRLPCKSISRNSAGKPRYRRRGGASFSHFGAHEHEKRLVPSVVRHLLMNQEALCTHGQQVRSFLHVADVGAAFAQLLDSSAQGPVNIGSGERISLAELIERIGDKIGHAT